MATTTLPNFGVLLITLVSILLLSSIQYGATAKYKPPRLQMTKIKVHWHDIMSGPKQSSYGIIQPVANQTNGFGWVQMIDNPLTLKVDSGEVGRAQGLYASDSLEQGKLSFLMLMNFVFTAGKYNGSTITIMGKNNVMDKVREMSVVGGTGVFRMARGYALAQTRKITQTEAIVQYELFVMHYKL